MAGSGQQQLAADAVALVGQGYERARNIIRELQPAGLISKPGRGSRDPMFDVPQSSNTILGTTCGRSTKAAETVRRIRGLIPVGASRIVKTQRLVEPIPGTSDYRLSEVRVISVYRPDEPALADALRETLCQPADAFVGAPFGTAFDGLTKLFIPLVDAEEKQRLREAIQVSVMVEPETRAVIAFSFPNERLTISYQMSGPAAEDFAQSEGSVGIYPRPTHLSREFSGEIFEGMAALVKRAQRQTKETARAPTPAALKTTNGQTTKTHTHPLQDECARKRARAQAPLSSFGRFSNQGEPADGQKTYRTG